eukprot:CAMPEP_0115875194 /NCGR_PEP_ID=MMETSP0287-20121206/24961_1 /TAXON_ID=412157 /ORGANISM="Chrysochromulina rotalis, Strain UIO044" /LENGTH=42 /DNA_ID= /DNA_START= /DNA_END= /DNA_ORIENTATION=
MIRADPLASTTALIRSATNLAAASPRAFLSEWMLTLSDPRFL